MMDMNEYQEAARKTAIYPAGFVYPALGLAGEAGEVAEKVKKALRDDAGEMTERRRAEIALELGDVLWYVANMAHELGISLEDVAAANVCKLRSRQGRQALHGEGDSR